MVQFIEFGFKIDKFRVYDLNFNNTKWTSNYKNVKKIFFIFNSTCIGSCFQIAHPHCHTRVKSCLLV